MHLYINDIANVSNIFKINLFADDTSLFNKNMTILKIKLTLTVRGPTEVDLCGMFSQAGTLFS